MISFLFCSSSFIMQIQLTEPRPGRVNQCTVHRKNKTSYCKNRLEFKQQAGLDFKLGFDGIQVEIATLFSLQRHKISLGFSACRMQRYVPYHIQSTFKLLANLLAEKETIVQLCYEVVLNKLQLIILGWDHLYMYLCLSVCPSKMLCVFHPLPSAIVRFLSNSHIYFALTFILRSLSHYQVVFLLILSSFSCHLYF